LWLEPLPAAEIASRLRRLPLFASVTVDELFRLASTSRQVRHQPGTVLLQEGVVPDTIHVLLDGRTVASGPDAPQTIVTPATLGFVHALQGVPVRSTIRTIDTAVTLALSVDEFRTLLADNTDLVRGLFATLAERADSTAVGNLQSTGAAADFAAFARESLLPVEKILALQRVPVFGRIAADEMGALAKIVRTVTMTAGTPLFAESAPVALWVILSGEVSLDAPAGGNHAVAKGGDIIGSLSMLSGQPLGQNADVLGGGIALKLDRDELFDLLGERPELLRQLFEGMFRVRTESASEPAGVTS
jgi:CRP-like cAMP-binding protein